MTATVTRNFLIVPFLLLCLTRLGAQRWIDKKYTYDSLLNITYGSAVNFNGTVDSLRLDLYLPACDDPSPFAKRPLLLWIHGGAFLAGDKNDASITRLCKQFAKRGYVTASVGYRLGFVSDDAAWTCNFPNYSCVFAGDSAEWIRAWYRGVQDAKGALRYLVNRNSQYQIDLNNIFVAGESAGSFIALGVGLLDTISERPLQTFSISSIANPNNNTASCAHNTGKSFTMANVMRPDLGDIEGTIEPTSLSYTVRGIGNIYGAMFSNLLRYSKSGKPKPAVYSFHQPCDLVVPIDSGKIYAGLSWCMTNGYNCSAIANTPKVYGSRAFSNWNTTNAYGYTIQNEFTSTNFPFNYLFGTGSCLDQVNKPCHAYDNATLRENNLAAFFAPLVSGLTGCETANGTGVPAGNLIYENFMIFPNPAGPILHVQTGYANGSFLQITDLLGQVITALHITEADSEIAIDRLSPGIYFCRLTTLSGQTGLIKFIKE